MARLIVIKGADEGKQFDLLTQTVGIGRERTNPICLHDTEVSRRHAEIVPGENGAFRIRDLASANGTQVNTKPVSEALSESRRSHPDRQDDIGLFAGTNRRCPTNRSCGSHPHGHSSGYPVLFGHRQNHRGKRRQPDAGPARTAPTQWLKDRLANLSIVYETIQAISHILDLDQLLDRIMELIFSSIEADHGCIMLRNADNGEFEPKAIRFRAGINHEEKIVISRTIMDYVLTNKQGVLIADAGNDDRFSGGNSIKRFKIREAICVPMKGRHETHGVMFLDTQSTSKDLVSAGKEDGSAKFTEDHLALAIAIAHQASLAVEETRYHQALVHAERLAAVGNTIAALSHHIKNIMQGVVFGSDMVPFRPGGQGRQPAS